MLVCMPQGVKTFKKLYKDKEISYFSKEGFMYEIKIDGYLQNEKKARKLLEVMKVNLSYLRCIKGETYR